MSKFTALLFTIALGGLYLLLAPLSSSAVVLFPVAAYYLRRSQSSGALLVLLLGSTLADLMLPQATPRYLVVSLAAAALYLEVIEPHLSPSSALSSTLGLVLWLLTWRLVYLGYLALTLLLSQNPPLTWSSLVQPGLTWLGGGLLVWLLLLAIRSLLAYVVKKRRPSIRHYA